VLVAKASHPNYLKDLSTIIKKFPPGHIKFIQALAVFLSQFAKHADQNRMQSSSISMIFGPNTLYSIAADPQKQITDGPFVKAIFQTIIDHHNEILTDL
jgi:hypothetical protein